MKSTNALTFIAFVCVSVFCINTASAQTTRTTMGTRSVVNNIDKAGQFGAGLQAGSFSGVTLDYWYNSANAWNAGILGQYGNLAATAAHQWYFPGAFRGDANILVPYIGAGLMGVFGTHQDDLRDRTQSFALAAQMPFGLELLPSAQRFGIFAELKPSVELTPDVFAFLNADIGGRFYF